MQKLIETIFAAGPSAKPYYLARTGWLDDAEPEKVEQIYREYSGKYRAALSELEELMDKPQRSLESDREWIRSWFPEAIEAAVWQRNDRYLCLAVEHHDRETPVGLVLRCLTAEELQELSK